MDRFIHSNEFNFENITEASYKSAVVISRYTDYLEFLRNVYKITENKIKENNLGLKVKLYDELKGSNDKFKISVKNLSSLLEKTNKFFNSVSNFEEIEAKFQGYIENEQLNNIMDGVINNFNNRPYENLKDDVEDLFKYLSDVKKEYIDKNLQELSDVWIDENFTEFCDMIIEDTEKMEKCNDVFVNALQQKMKTDSQQKEEQDDVAL